MNRSDIDDRLSEPELERLLQDFFARELPRELRDPQPVPRLRILSPAPNGHQSRFAAVAVVAAACVLAFVVLLARTDPATTPVANDAGPAEPRETSPLPDWDDGEPIERKTLLTEQGPVEERSHLKYRRVTVEDPETGRKAEVLLPELDIELRPLEQSPPERLPE